MIRAPISTPIFGVQNIHKEEANMPRPKGSKNKPKTDITLSVDQLNEKIASTEAEIASLTESLKSKKAELKALTKEHEAAEKAAAEAKEAEQKAKLLEAVASSGKSIDEVIALIQG